jgi:hypothetical protein
MALPGKRIEKRVTTNQIWQQLQWNGSVVVVDAVAGPLERIALLDLVGRDIACKGMSTRVRFIVKEFKYNLPANWIEIQFSTHEEKSIDPKLIR